MKRTRGLFFILSLCLAAWAPLAAELADSSLGFYLDLPEGYETIQSGADGKYAFQDPTGLASFQIAAYPGSTYISADAIAQDLKRRLKGDVSGKRFSFQGRDAYFADLSFSVSGVQSRGYGFFVNGAAGERDYVVLSTVDAANYGDYSDLLKSALDSFSLDRRGLKLPGPVSWSAAPFDGSKEIQASLRYAGSVVQAPVRSGWEDGARNLVEREYRVLTAYAGAQDLWKDAWRRFYRMVFRDSYSRLDSIAFALGLRMEELWRDGRLPGIAKEILKPSSAASASTSSGQGDSAAPGIPDAALVEATLAIVQGHTYLRDPQGSDFTDPLTAILDGKGDCDARAMLVAILLQHWNRSAAMMVSQSYSHAMALVDLPGSAGKNAGIEVDGKRYLVAETTAAVKPGLISQDQSDPAQWIGIGFQF